MSQTKVQLVNDVSGNSGFGLSSATGVVHLHESSSGSIEGLKVTNSTTGTAIGDGLSVGLDSSENVFIFNYESTAIKFGTSGSERMRIDSSGNVGLGSTSPTDYDSAADNLVVQGSGNTGITLATTNTASNTSLVFSDGTGDADSKFRGAVQYIHNGDVMRFLTASAERMRIDDAGRVSIGTTTNSAHLNVHINAASRVPVDVNDTNNTSTLTHRLRFLTGGTEVGRIRSSNTATVYDTSGSDVTLKKNFEDWTENTLDLFKNINPQKFHFIQEEDTAKKSKGFIAQEMVDSFPEAYTKEDKEDSKYFFNPSGMVVYLMKALQEAVARIEALEAA